MLRKHLGSGKVATLIWKHGLPALFDAEVTRDITRDLLQSSLEDAMQWWIILIKNILQYEDIPELHEQRALSSMDDDRSRWRSERREALRNLREQMRRGEQLAEERDSKKRSFDEMASEEQSCLHNWEKQKTKKQREELIFTKGVGFNRFLM
jgi:hypothetical protein